MKEFLRTLTFVGVAVVSVGLAWFVHASSQSEEIAVFAKVGTEFYPDFDDPTKAGSLEIIDYDETNRQLKQFKVEFQRGQWRIPSHHGYPADAEDRLEKAAASLVGISRKSVAGRRENAHERFSVVKPPETANLGTEVESPDALGQRIILKDKNGNVLADYILGKRVADRENLYFVRTPNEEETYHAEIELDVSTKFSDWIEKDLLKLDRSNLLSMELKTPKFELAQTPFGVSKTLVGENSLKVHRKETGPGTEWKIDELNSETEEINTSGIGRIQTGLDGLELNGVRPKPRGITPELALDLDQFPPNEDPQNYFNELQNDLSSRGFMLARPKEESSEQSFLLFGEGGEMVARSNEGLVYHLHFGRSFSGTPEEIEVGKTDVADEEGNEVIEDGESSDSPADNSTDNRYLFIRVEFDKSLLGEAPTEPEKPQKPEGLAELKEVPAETESESPKADENKEKTPEEIEQDKLRKDYESQLALYKNEKAIYEEDVKEYQERLKAGETKVQRLNDRFGDWYYVIPASSYDNLTFTRADVVKEKEKEQPQKQPGPPGTSPTPGSSPIEDFIKNRTGAQEPGPAPQPKPAKEGKPAVAEKPAGKAAETDEPTPQN